MDQVNSPKPVSDPFTSSTPINSNQPNFLSTPESSHESLSIPTPETNSVFPPSPSPVSNIPSPELSKKPFNKIFLILLIIIVLIVGLFLIFIFFIKGKQNPLSNLLKKSQKQKITLNYWGLFEPSSVFQQVIEDYQKQNPHVQINYIQENLKLYRERLQASLEKKQGPDIFRIHQTWIPMLGELLSPLPSTVYSPQTFESTFYPSAKETLKYKNQYVAIPLMVDGLALYYNEDLFKSRGVVPPTNWSELKKLACQLTVKDEKGKIRIAGVALGTTNNVDHWPDILGLMILQNGGSLTKPDSCINRSDNEQLCLAKDALLFYTLFVSNRACIEEEFPAGAVWSSLLPSSTYAFATGQVAMYFGPSWRAFDIKNINDKLNFKIIPVPQLPGNKVTWSSYWVEAVAKGSPHQEEAWKFLAYLSSKEVLQKLYQTQGNLRLFGEPFSRVDMSTIAKGNPLVSPFIEQAPFAKSWYLSSFTFDNGLNDKIIKYYEDAVNSVNKGGDPLQALQTVSQGVNQILVQYGISSQQ